jgi:hypothetical protein
MPRTCTLCCHAEREDAERALLAGESYRNIAARFGCSTSALVRHREHLKSSLVESHKVAELSRATTLLEDVRSGEGQTERLYLAVDRILAKALEAEDLKTALNAVRVAVEVIREGRSFLELRGELSDQLGERNAPRMTTTINVLSMPRVPGAPIRASDPPIDVPGLPAVRVGQTKG